MSPKSFAFVLLLGVCAPDQLRYEDGYRISDTGGYAERTITVKLYPSKEAMKQAYKGEPPNNLAGFSRYNGRRCVIHIVDPVVRYKPTIMGHELNHCIYGDWHRGQNNPHE